MNLSISNKRPLMGHQMVFLTIVGFWVFHALIVSLRAAVLEFPSQGELATRRILVTIIGIALTWMLYLILRLFDRKPLGVRVATAFIAAAPCAFVIAWANYYVFNVYDPVSVFSDQELGRKFMDIQAELGLTAWQEVAEIAVSRYFFLIAWASLYLALGYARDVSEAERTASRYAQAAQDAELRSLRYQVNPHFLFNTLNSLSALVMTGKGQAAEQMIQTLSTFYRRSLAGDPTADVALDQEIALQRLYLEIEAVRFPDRLRTRFDIPAALADARMPGMILQPLIENAVKYAVSATTSPVTLTITARQEHGGLVIEVADDGPVTKDSKPGFGIGLANVRDRLAARYGDAAQFDSGPVAGGGWRSVIRLPLERHD